MRSYFAHAYARSPRKHKPSCPFAAALSTSNGSGVPERLISLCLTGARALALPLSVDAPAHLPVGYVYTRDGA